MITLSIEEIDARDMRRAAIHECAHAQVAWHYGMWAQPYIWRNDSSNPYEEVMWSGYTRYLAINRTPMRNRRIAIAGMVAELMDHPEFEVEGLEEDLSESYMFDEWSITDYEGAEGWTPTDLRSVYSILKRNWKAIEAEAEGLIKMWTELDSAAISPSLSMAGGGDERSHGRRTPSKRKTKCKGSRSPRVVTKGSGSMQRSAAFHPPQHQVAAPSHDHQGEGQDMR